MSDEAKHPLELQQSILRGAQLDLEAASDPAYLRGFAAGAAAKREVDYEIEDAHNKLDALGIERNVPDSEEIGGGMAYALQVRIDRLAATVASAQRERDAGVCKARADACDDIAADDSWDRSTRARADEASQEARKLSAAIRAAPLSDENGAQSV